MAFLIQEETSEGSTLTVEVSFFDENELYVIPSTITWNLSDIDGNIINDRSGVVVETNPIILITLTGDDLLIEEDSDAIRVLTVMSIYNSNIGTDLSMTEDIKFKIKKVRSLSNV